MPTLLACFLATLIGAASAAAADIPPDAAKLLDGYDKKAATVRAAADADKAKLFAKLDKELAKAAERESKATKFALARAIDDARKELAPTAGAQP
jgi:hypothetical protein